MYLPDTEISYLTFPLSSPSFPAFNVQLFKKQNDSIKWHYGVPWLGLSECSSHLLDLQAQTANSLQRVESLAEPFWHMHQHQRARRNFFNTSFFNEKIIFGTLFIKYIEKFD
ncbi:hypothetical protein KIL84_006248 [Mauremys mutica]|uniref:Uncharacterized protein n=1 Tax=Mauremys mutica TaxID=74926 RepID=A0A9D3X129_9SAUR|nr:hypothetical protein KIL84_006248 [Mauremys mutica]